jgi:hypothetical protein
VIVKGELNYLNFAPELGARLLRVGAQTELRGAAGSLIDLYTVYSLPTAYSSVVSTGS